MGFRYRFGALTLDVAAHELLRDGVPVPLQARVFECLTCLIAHRDRAVGRDELLMAVFARTEVSDAQLAQIVLRARRAVGDDGQGQRLIRTVPRFGFRWVAATVEVGADTGDDARTHPIRSPGDIASPVAASAPPAQMAAVDAEDDAVAGDGGRAHRVAHAEAVGGADAPATPWTRRRAGWMLACVVLAAIAGGAWWLHRSAGVAPGPRGAAPASRAVAVLPVEGMRSDEASWARLGLMDFIADRLRRSGLPVASSETVIGVLRALPGTVDPARAREALRTPWIVTARAARRADGWHVALVARHHDGTQQRGQATDADLLGAARRAADRLAAALGGRLQADDTASPDLGERLQRARVAMLANELDGARRILLDAPELQQRQPRLRYQMARIDFRAGDYAQGLATLDAVLSSRDVADDRLFHAQVLNARGAMLLRLGRLDAALADYDAAIALVSDGRHPTERGVAFSGRGVAHAMQQAFDLAVADLGRARADFDDAGDALAMARVDGNLGTLEADRGRPAQGLAYLTQSVDALATMGAVNELATVRNARTSALLQLLRYDEAVTESDRAWALWPRLSDPAQRADLLLSRAAVLLATGRLGEAGRLLAMPDAARGIASEHGRRELLDVELARVGHVPAQAVKLADAALKAWPADGDPRLHAWLESTREQAALEAELGVRQSPIPSSPDLVPAQLVQAARARARGDRTGADHACATALALAEQRGIPAEILAAAAPCVDGWLEQDRLAEVAPLLGRLAPLAAQDFDFAVLQLHAARATGQRDRWRAAWVRASKLAGERRLPAGLDPDAH